eukprot:Skav213673  [mRNA]  locus=scaffold491:202377:206143:- [translate_table: standard]
MDPASLVKMMIDWKVALSTGVPTVWQGVRAYIELGVEFLQGWGMTETNPMGSIAQRVCKYSDLTKSEDEKFKNEPPSVKAVLRKSEYFQVDAPEKFHDGWLVTGDVAKIDEEGAIVISDRSKDVIRLHCAASMHIGAFCHCCDWRLRFFISFEVVKSGGEWISSIDMENQTLGAQGSISL